MYILQTIDVFVRERIKMWRERMEDEPDRVKEHEGALKRVQRAYELFQRSFTDRHLIVALPPTRLKVNDYLVDLSIPSCQCEDYKRHGEGHRCKHILAAALYSRYYVELFEVTSRVSSLDATQFYSTSTEQTEQTV
jgi:hypothetical protein